ncbi:DJ-1 family glyoxalase III [Peptoniphilus catoniae]|uniref:DJ-1 family glyoxalase III n=1 Tax=Peptoniphilus catoniae TaxID=1660341 RepID=UPI0010FD7902|nr:DJ-1 family glyoxalase III [Peptoniphilus catoniae]
MKDLLIFLADGFEDIEALTISDYLRRADLTVDLVSINEGRMVESAHGVKIEADLSFSEIIFEDYRAIYIPGGLPGATNLADDNRVIESVEMYSQEDKLVAAICAGPVVLDRAKLLKDNEFTCFPGYEGNLSVKGRKDLPIYEADNIVTAMGPSFAQVLAFRLIEILKDEESAQKVKEGTLFTNLVDFIKKGQIK